MLRQRGSTAQQGTRYCRATQSLAGTHGPRRSFHSLWHLSRIMIGLRGKHCVVTEGSEAEGINAMWK
jgi:hypothetical protein